MLLSPVPLLATMLARARTGNCICTRISFPRKMRSQRKVRLATCLVCTFEKGVGGRGNQKACRSTLAAASRIY